MKDYNFSKEEAESLDNQDPLKEFRGKYFFPRHNGEEALYFTGNSLGLQPRGAKNAIEQELDDWAKYGVDGHFKAKNPWVSYHEPFAESLAKLVGAKPSEVVLMNTLTSNLHFLMVSFYRPSANRYKILSEFKPFPSDFFALESQLKFHDYDPKDALIEVAPREKEYHIEEDDIINAIERHKNELALVMIGGVNYYTGQRFDMERISKKCKKYNITVGFDLAHAVGNVELNLHDWEVDFAAWCSYKYLNSGPGAASGVFIHEKHHGKADIPRFNGWWGHDKGTRFKMEKHFVPIPTAEAWQTSNAPVMNMAIHRVALNLFMEAGLDKLFAKRDKLTDYAERIITSVLPKDGLEIITPNEKTRRGSQLTLLVKEQGKELFDYLSENGVVADWREPNGIRIAPVPMYNSYMDVWQLAELIKNFYNI